MHPDLVHAVILAAIAKVPNSTKRRLVSAVPERREQAEDVVAASIVVALAQRRQPSNLALKQRPLRALISVIRVIAISTPKPTFVQTCDNFRVASRFPLSSLLAGIKKSSPMLTLPAISAREFLLGLTIGTPRVKIS